MRFIFTSFYSTLAMIAIYDGMWARQLMKLYQSTEGFLFAEIISGAFDYVIFTVIVYMVAQLRMFNVCFQTPKWSICAVNFNFFKKRQNVFMWLTKLRFEFPCHSFASIWTSFTIASVPNPVLRISPFRNTFATKHVLTLTTLLRLTQNHKAN